MNKEIKEQLQKLQKEIGIHDALIHDIYGSLISRLGREVAYSLFMKLDIKGAAREASKIYHFFQGELGEKELKETNMPFTCDDFLKMCEAIKVKPLCNEICADPDLVEVMDSKKETEEVRQRERARVANCPLKKIYRCRF